LRLLTEPRTGRRSRLLCTARDHSVAWKFTIYFGGKRCRALNRFLLDRHPGAFRARRLSQARALSLQARLRPAHYTPNMRSGGETNARLCAQDAAQPPESSLVLRSGTRFSPTRSSEDTWELRRSIVRARCALINMRLADASRATAHLKRLLSGHCEPSFARYACTLRLLEASILAAQDDFSAARSLCRDMAGHTGDAVAAAVLRYLDWEHGKREQLCAPDTIDYLTPPVGGNAVCRILSLCVCAALAFDRLELAVSAKLAADALQLARRRFGSHSPISTFPATLLAQVAYEQGRLEEAEALLRPRFSVIRASGMLECVARASVLLARISLHRGRHRAALTLLRDAEALGRARRWPRLVSIVSSEYARVIEPDRIGREPQAPGGVLSFSSVAAGLRRVSCAASRGSGDDDYERLIPWLRIGAARGLCMVFLDAGQPVLDLLRRLYYTPPTDDPRFTDLRPYVTTLLTSTLDSNGGEQTSVGCRPLSRRETGILQLIADGMSNKRIAQSLGITPETVKSHTKSIFVKLATRTRAHAVARAEAVGFL